MAPFCPGIWSASACLPPTPDTSSQTLVYHPSPQTHSTHTHKHVNRGTLLIVCVWTCVYLGLEQQKPHVDGRAHLRCAQFAWTFAEWLVQDDMSPQNVVEQTLKYVFSRLVGVVKCGLKQWVTCLKGSGHADSFPLPLPILFTGCSVQHRIRLIKRSRMYKCTEHSPVLDCSGA